MAESDPRGDDVEWTKPILLLAGPTASGKSRLALDLARRREAVILNADSQQLYTDLRILTARPSLADEAMAEHRLYGVADAADAWSVGRWLRAAMVEIEALRREGRPMIVVGGTGLYFRALTHGLADIPAVPDRVRDQAQTAFDKEGEVAFRRHLSVLDPEAASRIAPGDRQRLVRAHSVATHTGRALTSWRAATRPALDPDDYQAVVREPDRQILYSCCDQRAATMFEEGAVDEVQALVERGLNPILPAMKAVGVQEIAGLLAGELAREPALAAVKQATRRYAKRQLTWFRNQCGAWPRV